MKKIIIFLITGLLMLSLQSCEELNITFEDVVIEETLNIENLVPKSASTEGEVLTYSFSENTIFSLSDAKEGDFDEDLSDYLESLSSVLIKSMSFTILEIAADKSLLVNNLEVTISLGEMQLYSESFLNISPMTPIEAIGLNTEVVSAISAALMANQELTLEANGEVTGDVQAFQILAKIVSDVEANALDALDSAL